ncbi:MAG: helix-turn-helix domain-containing protein [Aggregatilineales bacterium]
MRPSSGGGGRKRKLAKLTDQVLFILVYEKTYPLQTMLGLQFGLSQGSTNKWSHRLLPMLQHTLQGMGHTPEREDAPLADTELTQAGGSDLVMEVACALPNLCVDFHHPIPTFDILADFA